ncbi:hypothetical protein MNL09_03155 [Bartonella krasnovii]|nr:hypothetical protein MNL09_03155 [Bartonella krasnovii]
MSVNATYPDGYTANNSGKIGGFHALCADVGTISGHPLSGYRAGIYYPILCGVSITARIVRQKEWFTTPLQTCG